MNHSNNERVREIRFEIAITLPGSLNEIVDEIISKTIEHTETQLRAAMYLGVTPATISNRLNHHRKRLRRPAHATSGESTSPDQ
jgi:hypothetical protein